MHDIRTVRADPAAFDAALARRGLPCVSASLLEQDAERRAVLTALQEKQARRNAIAREVGQGRRSGADTSVLEAEATVLRGDMEAGETRAAVLED
jgi:seryl-tRNA synthetase